MARIVFMGTPEFAVPCLERLIAAHEVVAVVTQPDRPAGRGRDVHMSPVKQCALAANIPVLQPEKIRRAEAVDALRAYPAEFNIVAAFGQILPQVVLDLPSFGSINVHASLLPRWRGAAPIQAAIRAGDAETGVTIMQMDAGLDTGAMLRWRAIPILPTDTGATMHDKLSQLGAELLMETLPGVLDGTITPIPQPDEGVVFAPRIEKDQGRIVWSEPADAIARTIRAFTPWPGTFTTWDGHGLKVLVGEPMAGSAPVGQVVLAGNTVAVGTGSGLLAVHRVQLEGRKPAEAEAFVRGYPAFVGSVLGV